MWVADRRHFILHPLASCNAYGCEEEQAKIPLLLQDSVSDSDARARDQPQSNVGSALDYCRICMQKRSLYAEFCSLRVAEEGSGNFGLW